MPTVEGPPSRSSQALAIASSLAFVRICGLPYLRWWADPSLFDDDFLRVGSLRHSTLGAALFRPFNEHMAPLFEMVSWLAWVGAGQRILVIPLAFQVASFLAFGLTAGMVAAWVRVEVGSMTAALLAVALFCLSAVSAETVLWYSASSFQWAASTTLASCLAASMASSSTTTRGRLGWSVASGVASLASPAFSAIGILAGPLAAVRVASAVDRPSSRFRRFAWSIVPLLGTAGYFLICERFQYADLVSASVRRSFDPLAATWATIRAPAAVLVPGLVGLPEQSRAIPGVILAGLTLTGLVATLVWSARSRQRPFILSCLALILGGYFLTYATRARPGDPWIFEIRRYHLFPQIGLIGLIAAVASSRLRRLDESRARGWFAMSCLAGLLAIVQYPAMRPASDQAFRYPDQPRAIATVGRLEQICDREGITLPQAMFALEPIRPPWYPNPWPFNPLLNLLPTGPTSPRVANALVRQTLIESLAPEDRESLFGGMEATRHGLPARTWASPEPAIEARPLDLVQRSPASTWHADYRVDPASDNARALSLNGFRTSKPLELWWAGDGEDWSPYRSVRWVTSEPVGDDLAVAFEMMPHWRRGEVRRIRVVSRDPKSLVGGLIRFLK